MTVYSIMDSSIEGIRDKVAKLFGYREHDSRNAIDVRPIIPEDLGLEAWVWTKRQVAIRPKVHLAITGIHSAHILRVDFRLGVVAGNIVAITVSGQPLYEAYWWRKDEELTLEIKLLYSEVPRLHFSILGYVLEPRGMMIA